MARPVTQADRDQVAELHAAGMSRAAIARELGRSPSTIGKIADRLGLGWDRTATEVATKARQVDLAARRAELAALLLDDAFRMRERMWSPYTVRQAVGGGEGVEVVAVTNDLPPAAETRNLATSLAILVDKHVSLVKADADDTGASAVDEWLRTMLGGGQ